MRIAFFQHSGNGHKNLLIDILTVIAIVFFFIYVPEVILSVGQDSNDVYVTNSATEEQLTDETPATEQEVTWNR